MNEVDYPLMDAIITKENINEMEIRRLLLDKGSSHDILFLDASLKMGIIAAHLIVGPRSVARLSGHETLVVKKIILLMTYSEDHGMATKLLVSLILDMPSIYNRIVGSPSQATFGMISSIKHQVIKLFIKGKVVQI